jgi:ABC-2 type transport system ATP-binding protein
MPFLLVEGVSKKFAGQTVLENMNFHVNKGEIVGLLGPNGSGKTTTVRLLNGVILPDSGTLRVGGHDPVQGGDAIRRMSGILTEGAGLYHEMSGRENLKFFAELYGVKKSKGRIDELLERFDLARHGDKRVGTYSTGMKKRLGLAKALLHEPELLFLDEPTNGLDPEGTVMVMDFIKELNRTQGTTILLCSHVLHQIEDVCHRYVFMEQGRVIEQMTLPEMERAYLTEIRLRVETGLQVAGDTYGGYPVRRVDAGQIEFALPDKDAISELLGRILQESYVHAAEITNRDLEALYFEVRRRHHHE